MLFWFFEENNSTSELKQLLGVINGYYEVAQLDKGIQYFQILWILLIMAYFCGLIAKESKKVGQFIILQ